MPRRVLNALLLAPLALGACGKLDHFGRPPTMSGVGSVREPVDPTLPQQRELRRASVLNPDGAAPLRPPLSQPPRFNAASLWSSTPSSLFGDRRARGIGDILTVVIDIADSAELTNETTRSRSGSDAVAAGNTLFGLEAIVDNILPADAEISNGVSASGSSESSGAGQVARDETISLRVAATVVEVLPNGHFVISGSQEVRVNFELRDLQVVGIIRPEDISRRNTITYDKIANARISYGGRGQITDVQQPRYGQQIIDLISPF